MSNDLDLPSHPEHVMFYQIRIRGHLGTQWAEWFGGLKISQEATGDTLLTGPVVDQAALHGLLKKVRDLGIPLLLVSRLETDHPATPDSEISP